MHTCSCTITTSNPLCCEYRQNTREFHFCTLFLLIITITINCETEECRIGTMSPQSQPLGKNNLVVKDPTMSSSMEDHR